jgi:hypothetical protein
VFNPLDHDGIPLDDQDREWRELTVTGIRYEDVDPYTRCRVVAMSGVESDAVRFDRWTVFTEPDPLLRNRFRLLRSVEARQRRALGDLLQGPDTVLETALTYERAAVDLDSWLARIEPDPVRRKVYQSDALEDFDHAYRYAELLDTVGADRLVDELTTALPERSAAEQPEPGPETAGGPGSLSALNALTMLAVEQLMTTFYDNTADRVDPRAGPVYREVRRAERDQVARHRTLVDAGTGRWQQLVTREYNECRLYHAFLAQEPDARVRAVWELSLQLELGQLHAAADLLRRFDGREPEEVLGTGVPEPPGFDRNLEYLRRLLARHLDLDALGSAPIRAVPQVRAVREDLDRAGRAGSVLDVLSDQHTHIESLFYECEVATDERRHTVLDELIRLISEHEAIEDDVVHPLARDIIPGGFEVTRDLVEEERHVRRMLTELVDAGVEAEDFDDDLANLRDAVLSHAAHEERYEFPELRERVPADRLRELG